MSDVAGSLTHAPLPKLLIVAGIAFLAIGVLGNIANKIAVVGARNRLLAGGLGGLLVIVGLLMHFFSGRLRRTARTAERRNPAEPAAKPSREDEKPCNNEHLGRQKAHAQ